MSERESHDDEERAVLEALRRLRFGEVKVIVHDGHIVQVESTERVRLPMKR
jgi:hypothetical protein